MDLHIDFETRSRIDLVKQGHYKYAEDESTDILCLSIRQVGGLVACFIPPWVAALMPFGHRFAVLTPAVIEELNRQILAGTLFMAFNAGFERQIWRSQMVKKYGALDIPIKQVRCVAAKAMSMGMPNSLDGVAGYISPEFRKDATGKKVMVLLCKPDKHGNFVTPTEAHMKVLVKYCDQDTLVEESIDNRLPDLVPEEQANYELDQKINDQGFLLDVESIEEARQIIAIEKADKERLLTEATNGKLTDVGVPKIKKFLAGVGIHVDSLNKNAVKEMIKEATGDVLTVLKLRQELGQSSLAKYEAMSRCACRDNKGHGLLMFAAAHTSRWGGRLIQPQNLAQGKIKGVEKLTIRVAQLEYLRMIASPLDIVASAPRNMFIADPGEELLISDYSAIEARILGWYSGCKYLTDLFARYDAGDATANPYVNMAQSIYRDPNLVKADKKEYAVGKKAELGCGYGMGAKKFYDKCIEEGIDIEQVEADDAVRVYRNTHREVTTFWRRIEQEAAMCTGHFYKDPKYPDFTFCRLPSGRSLSYYKLRVVAGQMSYIAKDPDRPSTRLLKKNVWGGAFTENIVQAIARDIMACAMQRMNAAGLKIVLTVHDEIVLSVPAAEERKTFVEHLMTIRPDWAAGLPLAVESEVSRKYKK